MGLFTRKKKTTITGVVQRMTDDKDFMYSSKRAINEWIWDSGKSLGVNFDDRDLADYLIDYSNNALPRQYNRLYNFAKKPDKYIFGIPTSAISNKPENDIFNETIKYIETLHPNKTVTVLNKYIGDKNHYLSAWFKVLNDLHYNSETNELQLLSDELGTPCYLYDGVLYLTNETIQEYSSIGITNPSLAFNFGECFGRAKDITRQQSDYQTYNRDLMAIEFIFGNNIHASYAIDLSTKSLKVGDTIPKEYDYVYVTYRVDNQYYWFEYLYGSGYNKSIENAIDTRLSAGEYYPNIHIRLDQIDTVQSSDKTKKKDTKKIVKKLGLNADDLTKQIRDSIGSENYPDIRGIFIFMGVAFNTIGADRILGEYCFRYFKRLLDLSPKIANNKTGSGVQFIQDNYVSQVLSYESIELIEVDTNVIDGYEIKPNSYGLAKLDVNGVITHTISYVESKTKTYRLSIVNLGVTTSMSGYSFTKFGWDNELVIPLDRLLIKELSAKEREYVMYRSLHICAIHVKITKQKWYETIGFKVLITAIAIAITYVSGGTATPSMSAFLKAVAIGTAKSIALNLAVTMVLKIAVEAGIISPKTARILGVIATIAIGLYGSGINFSNVLTATNVMKVINTSFNAYNKLLQMQAQDTLNQMNELQLDYSRQQEYLNQAQKLLDTKVFDLNQELIRSSFTPTVNLFDTPEMFYSRHYNYDVIGLTHGLITNYVDGSLANIQLYEVKDEPVENVLLIT